MRALARRYRYFLRRYSAWKPSRAKPASTSPGRRRRRRRCCEELSMGAQDMTHAPATSSQPIGTLLVCLPSWLRPQVRSAVWPSVRLLTSLFPCTLSSPSWAHLNKILFALATKINFHLSRHMLSPPSHDPPASPFPLPLPTVCMFLLGFCSILFGAYVRFA